MLRPSHYGEPGPGSSTKPPKDPYRGIEPERLDRFSGAVDRQMGEMHSLCANDKPIRGKAVARLLMQVRALKLFTETFEAEVELAL